MRLTGMQLVEGEMAPWWYGMAYYSPYTNHVVYYPVPINLVVRWSRALWWALRSGKPDALAKAYGCGFSEGRRERKNDEQRQNQRVADIISLARPAK